MLDRVVSASLYTDIYLDVNIKHMINNNRYCVIMAGGSGTRFWPASRAAKPKQFLDVTNTGKTFIRHTYDRFLKIVPQENIIVVTAEKYKDLVLENIPELEERNLLLEPYARNTAPCVAYATYALLSRNPEAQVVVTPSDHMIDDEELFAQTIASTFEYVSQHDVLMTLGVVPTRPDTNYGYVQACGDSEAIYKGEPMQVKTFTEKPDKTLAQVFIDSGEFMWNAGIFVWKAKTIRKEMERHLPEVTGLFNGWDRVLGTPLEREFVARAFTECINISIDYGVMEKTDKAWIYPVKFGWVDIGTWESLYGYMSKDGNGNCIEAEKTLLEDSNNLMVVTPQQKKLVAISGLENFIVVDTDDVLLICPKDDKRFKDFISGIAMPEFEKYR